MACAAEEGRVDPDAVTFAKADHGRTDCRDRTGRLMTRHDRIRGRGELTGEDMQVRAAHSARPYRDDDVLRPRLRLGQLDLGVLARLQNLDRLA